MTADNSRAFFVSVALHAGVLGVAIYFTYAAAAHRAKDAPRILELVAGEGNNFRATEAPAIGLPGGIKLNVPKATPTELPKPEPPKPVAPKAETSPLTATPKAATPKAEPSMAAKIRRQLIVADSRAKKQVAKEREEEQKRISKEEFDKAQRAKLTAKNQPTKVDKIPEGIAKGVVGGSTSNKEGGAGGNALTVSERSEADAYAAFLNQQLTAELDAITGLDEGLRAEAEFEVQSSGRLARGHIVKSSHNERFDTAVLHAIAAVRMPEGPPKGFERVQSVTFSSHAKN